MRIPVKQVWTGVFNDNYITVQVIDKEEGVVWCNHDGAEDNEEVIHNAGSDLEWVETVFVCDKCDAFKREHEEHWEDAPFEGVS